jgi:hypothetical protein
MNAARTTCLILTLAAASGLTVLLLLGGCTPSSSPGAVQSATADQQAGNAASANAAGSRTPPKNITFDTIKLAKMKDKNEPFRRDMLTPTIEKLDGQRVRIRGFIFPPPQQTGLTRFMLVRDNMACCFGPGSWLYDRIKVDMVPGASTDYKLGPIVVEGVFDVHEIRMPDGSYMAIYRLTADKAQ